MANKGLKTKSERTIQFVQLSNPNQFDINGSRSILQAADDHSYKPSDTFDSTYRSGANAKSFNALTGRIRQGDTNGALYYNLFDAQIAPYVWGEVLPANDTVTGGIRQRIYEWAQMGRVDRPAFAVEEGAPEDALRGLNGHFNSLKITSKRDQSGGNSRVATTFTTTKAVTVGPMTGTTLQNAVFNFTGANVTTDGVFSVRPKGAPAQQVSLSIGDNAAAVIAKFAAIGLAVAVVGAITVGAGEKHTVTGVGDTFTLYGDTISTATATQANIQTGVRAKAGRSSAVVTANITAPVAGTATYTVTGADDPSYNGIYKDNGTMLNGAKVYQLGTGAAARYLYFQNLVNGLWGLNDSTNGGIVYGNYNNASPTPALTTYNSSNQNHSSFPTVALGAPVGAVQGSATVTVQYDAAAGNVGDVEAVPGVGYVGSSTQPGGAGGTMQVTVTAPANTSVTLTKISGTGWTGVVTQIGSDGKLRSLLRKPLPLLPQHLAFYAADTYAGLDVATSYIGGIEEFVLDCPKIREPRMPHNQTDTYSEVVDVEKPENALEILLYADQSSPAKATELIGNAEQYVSKAMYWRVVATCPESGYKIIWEVFGSIGKTVEQEFSGNVEERRLLIDVLENYEMDWNFRVITQVPVG